MLHRSRVDRRMEKGRCVVSVLLTRTSRKQKRASLAEHAESALAQVTDRDGKPIRDRIDAEAGHVDELRVPDDTGPLLRRALDHVAPGDAAADPPPQSIDGADSGTDDVA